MRNSAFLSRCRAKTAKKCTKKSDARAKLLFCSLNRPIDFWRVLDLEVSNTGQEDWLSFRLCATFPTFETNNAKKSTSISLHIYLELTWDSYHLWWHIIS